MKKILHIIIPLIFLFQAGQSQIIEQEIKNAVITLIDSLTPLQQKRALLKFVIPQDQMNKLPVGLRARAGLSIGNMNDTQRQLIHRIL